MTLSSLSDSRALDAGAVVRLVRSLHARTTAELRVALKPLGISPELSRVLDAIDAHPGINQHDLAGELDGAFHSRVVVWIDALEHRGWALRTVDPADHRRKLIWPTTTGHQAALAARRTINDLAVLAANDMGPVELATLRALLSDFHASARTPRPQRS